MVDIHRPCFRPIFIESGRPACGCIAMMPHGPRPSDLPVSTDLCRCEYYATDIMYKGMQKVFFASAGQHREPDRGSMLPPCTKRTKIMDRTWWWMVSVRTSSFTSYLDRTASKQVESVARSFGPTYLNST